MFTAIMLISIYIALCMIFVSIRKKKKNNNINNQYDQQENQSHLVHQAPEDYYFSNQAGKFESSVSLEILRLKNLVDTGILTQEEFEFKKKQLLGL